MPLRPDQIGWLTKLGVPPEAFDAVGSSLDDSETGGLTRTGPLVSIPTRPDGSPARVLEINAGKTNTDLGLPPDPVNGDLVDPSLVDVLRTDPQRTGREYLNANEPIPAEVQGGYDTVISNNPHGYVPDLENVSDALQPGGRIIVQGRAPANKDFTAMMDEVVPKDGALNPPPGMRMIPEMVDDAGNPIPFRPGGITVKPGQTPADAIASPDVAANTAGGEANPADIMGEGFNYTTGKPAVRGPNTRLILEKDMPPAATEPAPSAAGDAPTTTPSTAPADAEATGGGAEAGLGGAVGAGLLGGAIAGGMALYDDAGKVASGQMSLGDAAADVGGKAAGAGGLTFAGLVVADAVVDGAGAEAATAGAGAEAVAAGAGADAVAGVAGGAEAGLATVAGAALKGGVIGGVVAGGMALYDDVGKVESGQMTAGNATVDVGAKTAVGVAAGLAGAAAGAEIGAVIGTAIPIPIVGTAAGFVAGAVIGGAVGYVGNALMNTDTGKAVLSAAGGAVDDAIDGVEDAGKAVASVASAAAADVAAGASAAASAAGAAAGAVADAGQAVAADVSAAASAAVGVASDAEEAVASVASGAEKAASGLLGSLVDAVTGD